MAERKRHVSDKRLGAQAAHFGHHYLKITGKNALPDKERLIALNAATAGFYAGVRFLEANQDKFYEENDVKH